ncbi:MAG: hypothetical protein ABJQ29_03700 [Luteolibacter sp.]
MKNNYQRKLIQSAVISTVLGSGIALAGPVEVTPAPPIEVPSEDVVSGSFNLDYNSHFFSYGLDVWGDGDDAFQMGFYPSAELAFALPAGFSATVGVWAEVHEKTGATTTIGGNIQEIDIYAGLAYTHGNFTVGATYQNWFYLSDVEDILDITFSYDTFLSPSFTIHNRIDAGAANDEGTILVLGLEHGFEAGPVSFSIPFAVGYFLDDNFHSAGADDGFGYATLGLQASVPLSSLIGDAYGDWSLNAGVTLYVTDDGVIPNNPEDTFVATNIGLGLSF